jgi:glutamate decarboxylase
MLPATALQVVRDELILDGNSRLNLATFVTTWMEPQAEVLMAKCLGKNMIDKDEYPQTAELEPDEHRGDADRGPQRIQP